jgi:hypothetical protein
MNKDTILTLLQDGAVFDSKESKLIHPSFRKGFRKLRYSDISWLAVMRHLGDKLRKENNLYRI